MFSGNSSQASNGAGSANYIEDVFSTYLYTGNDSTLAINNGIDLSTKGGMVWIKPRVNAQNHVINDTDRGVRNALYTNTTGATNGGYSQAPAGYDLNAFNINGFTLGSNYNSNVNNNGEAMASWTFRKQPKFFDVVTYTGDGSTSLRAIAHNLGSTPGCLIIKKLSAADDWIVWHRGLTSTNYYLALNKTDAQADLGVQGFAVSDTTFSVIAGSGANTNGATYVAYLFAHNAGGFGAAGTDNVISCGSYTGTGSNGNAVTLGYEPQWVIVKNTTAGSGDNWWMLDSMRSMPVLTQKSTALWANSSSAELGPVDVGANILSPTATGFEANGSSSGTNGSGQTYIYIAIRRGPMKTPTDATKVFTPVARSGTGANTTTTAGFPVDSGWTANRGAIESKFVVVDRLRGSPYQVTDTVAAEVSNTALYQSNPFDNQTGINLGTGASPNNQTNGSGNTYVDYLFRRAPGCMDVVCYTGTGVNRTVAHNLGVVPELIIVSRRNATSDGKRVYTAATGNTGALTLDDNFAFHASVIYWNNTSPTSTNFTVGTYTDVNGSDSTYVAYLFASCPGVSKVGSYTGSGTTKQIDCGFTGGARFVLIKRTDSTGDWYVWDTARGLVSGNDPYLLLNSTAAETTGTDYIDPYSAGFELSSTAPAAINANGGSYIYLAIA